jgi:hypothetical protein
MLAQNKNFYRATKIIVPGIDHGSGFTIRHTVMVAKVQLVVRVSDQPSHLLV